LGRYNIKTYNNRNPPDVEEKYIANKFKREATIDKFGSENER
jgi:hypothetical protein